MSELKKLQSNATTDPLTGLYNRRLFEEHFEKELNRALRYNQHLALVMLDLHQFKEVNDRYGHPQGDTLLRQAAATLRKSLRTSDYAFRIGGDEFALLLVHSDTEQASTLARRIRANFGSAVGSMQVSVGLGMDYGIAVFPVDGDQKDVLVRIADQRLYDMKHQQRGGTTQPPGESQRLEQHPAQNAPTKAHISPHRHPSRASSRAACPLHGARTWRETQMGARFARGNSGLRSTGRRPAKNGASCGFGVRRRRAGDGTCRRIRIAIFSCPARSDSSAGKSRPEKALPGPHRQRTLESRLRVRFLTAGQTKFAALPLEAPLPKSARFKQQGLLDARQSQTPAQLRLISAYSARNKRDSQRQSSPPVRKPRGSNLQFHTKRIARFAFEQLSQLGGEILILMPIQALARRVRS